jgi:hypothetical protein
MEGPGGPWRAIERPWKALEGPGRRWKAVEGPRTVITSAVEGTGKLWIDHRHRVYRGPKVYKYRVPVHCRIEIKSFSIQ